MVFFDDENLVDGIQLETDAEKAKVNSESQSQSLQNLEAEKWHQQFLRVSADFKNFQRRIDKERASWIIDSKIDVLKVLLPVLDELYLAINSSQKFNTNQDMNSWLDGFKLIQKNLQKRLCEIGVEQIDCSGKFDPLLHEALVQVDSPDHKSGDIVQMLSPGYKLSDHVIIHAKVSVAK